MEFIRACEKDFETVYNMMLRAREKLYSEKIYQWDERYPKAEMIRHDLKNGYTFLVMSDGETVAFFTANSICEDDVHDNIRWIYSGSNWVILHRLCVEPKYQGKGLGQRILKMFEERAIEEGFESIRIDVFSTNSKAIHIYKKYLYKKVGNAVCERGPFFVYEKKCRHCNTKQC